MFPLGSLEILVNWYQSMRRHIPEVSSLRRLLDFEKVSREGDILIRGRRNRRLMITKWQQQNFYPAQNINTTIKSKVVRLAGHMACEKTIEFQSGTLYIGATITLIWIWEKRNEKVWTVSNYHQNAKIQQNTLKLFIISLNSTCMFRPAPAILRVGVIKYQVQCFKKSVVKIKKWSSI